MALFRHKPHPFQTVVDTIRHGRYEVTATSQESLEYAVDCVRVVGPSVDLPGIVLVRKIESDET